jgi:uncharacterized protein (TIGR00369 family)
VKRLASPFRYNGCFLCGQENPIGPKLEFYEADDGTADVVCRWTPNSAFRGLGNILHGAFQAGVLDEIMGWAAHREGGRPGVTSSFEMTFVQPVKVEEEMEVRGRVLSVQGSKIHLEAEIRDPRGRVCATARGTFHLMELERFEELVGLKRV